MICAVVITSYTRESIVGDAIRSVPWADLVVLVHFTNGEDPPDRTLSIAQEVAGDRLRVVELGSIDSCSKARNAGLDEATRLGADWAVQLDTDERILCAGVDIPGTLSRVPPQATALMAWCSTTQDHKARFFRLPASGRFHGFSHEDWRPLTGIAILPRKITVYEIPKSIGKLLSSIETILSVLAHDLEAEPDNQRWLYYQKTLTAALELKDKIDSITLAKMLGQYPTEFKQWKLPFHRV